MENFLSLQFYGKIGAFFKIKYSLSEKNTQECDRCIISVCTTVIWRYLHKPVKNDIKSFYRADLEKKKGKLQTMDAQTSVNTKSWRVSNEL